jgi:uncharacterized protein
VSSVAETLAEIYARIPPVACRMRCQDSCHDVPILEAERQRLGDLGCSTCPKLNKLGICTAHNDRPLMCRLWGVVENMRCPHGCEPATGLLTVAEGAEIVAAAERVAGPWLESTP